jgi:hypothetical protein
MDCDEETIEVLYNAAYGGYNLSEKAMKMFEERKTIEEVRYAEYDRDTPLILQIFHELGDEFSGKCCRVKSKKIKKKYENFYNITEYDGKERVEIDYYKYELVSTLLDDTMTDSEKINKLKEKFTRHI